MYVKYYYLTCYIWGPYTQVPTQQNTQSISTALTSTKRDMVVKRQTPHTLSTYSIVVAEKVQPAFIFLQRK